MAAADRREDEPYNVCMTLYSAPSVLIIKRFYVRAVRLLQMSRCVWEPVKYRLICCSFYAAPHPHNTNNSHQQVLEQNTTVF